MVGGGNSAGQAAVFLSRDGRPRPHPGARRGLAATMSDYLVQRIASSPRITLHPHTEITALAGDTSLRERDLDQSRDGRERDPAASATCS